MTPIAKTLLLTLIVAVFTVLTALHTPYINGPAYWRWPWRDLSPGPVYLTVLAAGLPILIATVLAHTRPTLALVLIVIGAAALHLSGAKINGPDAPSRIRAIVESPAATSYYTHAQTLPPGWLNDYPNVLNKGEHHARNKPPGPIWFYRTILDADLPDPALLGGILGGALALLSIVATYGLARAMGQERHASVLAAALMATAPGFVLFYPEFDQALAAIGTLMVITWLHTLKHPPETQASSSAIGFGLSLSLALLWSYALLTLGVFLGLLTLFHGLRTGQWRVIAVRVGIALATMAITQAGLWAFTGYSPITTFQTALSNQHDLLTQITRPWPATIPFDLLDLFLGMGWVMSALLLMGLLRGPSASSLSHQHIQLAALSALIIIATGLLPGETARVLIFVMPLLAVGAGAELARWPRVSQPGVLILALLGVAATVRTLVFIAV